MARSIAGPIALGSRPRGAGAVSGSSAPFTPAALGSKVTLWLDQRDQVVTGSGLSAWGDQSPGGTNDYAQGTDAARAPLSTINGWSAPDFDGAADFATCANAASSVWPSTGGHLFFVVDTTGETPPADNAIPSLEASLVGVNGGGWFGVSWAASGWRAYAYDSDYRVTQYVAAAAGKYLVEFAAPAGSNVYIRVNAGAAVFQGTPTNLGTLTLSGTTWIGRSHTGSRFFPGKVGFVLACNVVLSASETAAVRGYLANKYGVTA